MCADPGARTPIGASGNLIFLILPLMLMSMGGVGGVKGLAYKDPGARTPIGVSGN